MKGHIVVLLMIIAIWFSTAIAVSIGLYYTQDIKCLWFMLIPALMNIKGSNSTDSNE